MANDLQKALTGTGGTSKPRATALSGFTPPPPPPPENNQQQQPIMPAAPPAPSHNQTVATLRHFHAILGQLKSLVANPELGRTSLKDQIIEGMTKLVADRMVSPANAVSTLATVPERPFDQKAWAQQQLQTVMQARDLILQHHAQAFAGQPEQAAPSPDNHMADMGAMMQSHYQPQQNA